jgi:hypothetical protein
VTSFRRLRFEVRNPDEPPVGGSASVPEPVEAPNCSNRLVRAASVSVDALERWLKGLSEKVSDAAVMPLESLRRENLYE